MIARAKLLVLLLAFAVSPLVAGEMREQSMESAALGRTWSYSVYLPDGYDGSTARYPVIYLLPGLSVRRGEWLELALPTLVDAQIAAGTMKRPIVVVPEIGASWGIDGRERMQTALAEELPAEIERLFRTMPGRGGRAIAGISAGGFAALRLAMLHPDRYAAVALLSPAIYVPEPPANSGARRSAVFGAHGFDPAIWQALNYPALLPGFRAAGVSLPLYVGSGTADALGIAAHAIRLDAVWREIGMTAQLRLIDGGHTYAVWRALLVDALGFLLHCTDPDAVPTSR